LAIVTSLKTENAVVYLSFAVNMARLGNANADEFECVLLCPE